MQAQIKAQQEALEMLQQERAQFMEKFEKIEEERSIDQEWMNARIEYLTHT